VSVYSGICTRGFARQFDFFQLVIVFLSVHETSSFHRLPLYKNIEQLTISN
jgi:hypothetical protein